MVKVEFNQSDGEGSQRSIASQTGQRKAQVDSSFWHCSEILSTVIFSSYRMLLLELKVIVKLKMSRSKARTRLTMPR